MWSLANEQLQQLFGISLRSQRKNSHPRKVWMIPLDADHSSFKTFDGFFLRRFLSRNKWIILSHVFGSPTLPIKQFVLKMRSTIFYHFFNFCYDSTLNITNKNTIKKTLNECLPNPDHPWVWPANRVTNGGFFGIQMTFGHLNEWLGKKMICDTQGLHVVLEGAENGTRSVNKRCSVFFFVLGGFVFKGTLLNVQKMRGSTKRMKRTR